MATITKADFSVSASVTASNAAKAGITVGQSFLNENKNSSDVIVPNKVLAIQDKQITSGSSLTIDLYDIGVADVGLGAGFDNLGETHANSKIHSIMISSDVDSVGNLRIDQTVANSWDGITGGSTSIDLPAGGFTLISYGHTGKAVADGSNHILTLSAIGGDCDVTAVFVAS
jgi:hypothetical protein